MPWYAITVMATVPALLGVGLVVVTVARVFGWRRDRRARLHHRHDAEPPLMPSRQMQERLYREQTGDEALARRPQPGEALPPTKGTAS